MPASAITSASPSFATCTPTAPASSCICAIRGSLCVFVCGRNGDARLARQRSGPVDVRAHDVEVEHELRRVGRQLGQSGHPLDRRRFRAHSRHRLLSFLVPGDPGRS